MLSNGHREQVSVDMLDARYFKALDRFDIRFARTMWVYDNVRAKSKVLHLGCGSALLALLKRKDIMLAGVDVSAAGAEAARRNGYDMATPSGLAHLPFADNVFDYVVGFDVMDDLNEAERDSALREVKRVLRSGGVTLHGINCDERTNDAGYAADFLKTFQHVACESRFAVC